MNAIFEGPAFRIADVHRLVPAQFRVPPRPLPLREASSGHRLSAFRAGDVEIPFVLAITPGFVETYSVAQEGFLIDGQSLVIELAEDGWLDEDIFLREDVFSGMIIIDEVHPLEDLLSDTIVLRSAVFVDKDGDGSLSAAERDAGPVFVGENREADVQENTGQAEEGFANQPVVVKTGCGRDNLVAALPMLLFPAFFRRRCR